MSRAARCVVAVVIAAGLGACGDDGSDTTSAAKGRPAPAPSDSAAVTQPSVAPCTFSGATAEVEGNLDALTRLLTDVRVGAHDCYERVTFEFKPQQGEADGPVSWHAAYEAPPITEDGSGKTVNVKGAAFLVMRFSAVGADLSQEGAPATYTGPTVLETAGTTRIQQVRRIGDFEGVLTWVVGLDRERPFKVTTQDGPARVIVDLGD
jgi:hypothetical protein